MKDFIEESVMSSGKPDAFKNDFPNALKRNLHNWAQWRVDVNDQLVTSLMTGRRNEGVEPLGRYLHNSRHPTENPSTLLAYSASSDTESSLGMGRFLHYGIPRAKISTKPKGSCSEPDTASSVCDARSRRTVSSGKSSKREFQPVTSLAAMTIHENPELEGSEGEGFGIGGHHVPYHPPEPDPDYEQRSDWLRRNDESGSDDDDITAPPSLFGSSSTNSSDTESMFNLAEASATQDAVTSQRKIAKASMKKRALSRTYSTLNALDPDFMTEKNNKGTSKEVWKSSKMKKGEGKKKKKNSKEKAAAAEIFEDVNKNFESNVPIQHGVTSFNRNLSALRHPNLPPSVLNIPQNYMGVSQFFPPVALRHGFMTLPHPSSSLGYGNRSAMYAPAMSVATPPMSALQLPPKPMW